MVRHLAGCAARHDRIASARSGAQQALVHVRLQDAFSGAYWFDAEVRGTATLADIDSYLRAIWLECCGHLSRFSLGGWGGRDVAKRRRVGEVLTEGVELTHIYDFGTESITLVKAVGARRGAPLGRRPMVLMARNTVPQAPCVECGQPASHLCQECQIDWESPGTLCTQHADAHPHEEYGEPIEIVNSPRLGLCGYTGPADAPY
jgi:hypothetical protein